MVSINTVQTAAKEIKKRLSNELGLSRGSYKTTSSWSDSVYVSLKYRLMRIDNQSQQPGLLVSDKQAVRHIVDEVCTKYNIEQYSTNFFATYIEISLYSSEKPNRTR